MIRRCRCSAGGAAVLVPENFKRAWEMSAGSAAWGLDLCLAAARK
jgi:hypothetical protein